jgi:hypothetical protein
MPDYQLAKIYMLTCDNPDFVYYGSTTQRLLCDRLSGHKYEFKNNKLFCTSKLLFEVGNVKIELVENFPCNDKNELNAREAHYIRNNKCVNKCIPGRTDKEYKQDNKNRISKFRKEKIKCECGRIVTRSNLSKHMKTEKHKKLLIKNAEQARDSSCEN